MVVPGARRRRWLHDAVHPLQRNCRPILIWDPAFLRSERSVIDSDSVLVQICPKPSRCAPSAPSEIFVQSFSGRVFPGSSRGRTYWLAIEIAVLSERSGLSLLTEGSHLSLENAGAAGRNDGGYWVPSALQSAVAATGGVHRNLSATARRNLLLFAREPTPPWSSSPGRPGM